MAKVQAPQVVDWPPATFEPQQRFIEDEAYAVAAVTGIRAGKTLGGVIKHINYLLAHPGALTMVTAPTFPMLKDATIRTFNEICPRPLKAGGDGWMAGEMRQVMANGSEILFRSTDDPDRLRGPTLAKVWMDEAALSDEEAFKILLGRLSQKGYPPRIDVTTTPRSFNWVYEWFSEKGLPGYHLHQWDMRDNPFLSDEYLNGVLGGYEGDWLLQEVAGEFVAVGARVQFDHEWVTEQLGLASDVRPYLDERGLLGKLWAPFDRTHEYILGIDPKGEGKDLGEAVLLDWTAGRAMGHIRSVNGDPGALTDAAIDLALRYSPSGSAMERGCLCVPETNGVGATFAYRMREAGCRVYRRRLKPGEKPGPDWHWGWHTGEANRKDMLSHLQALARNHQLKSPIKEIWKAMLAWDSEKRPHMPDIVAALALACTAGKELWGDMGSSVAEAERREERPRFGWGPSAPRPFLVA